MGTFPLSSEVPVSKADGEDAAATAIRPLATARTPPLQLPSACLQQLLRVELGDVKAAHGLA
jgi:hypothetical protein